MKSDQPDNKPCFVVCRWSERPIPSVDHVLEEWSRSSRVAGSRATRGNSQGGRSACFRMEGVVRESRRGESCVCRKVSV